MKVRLPITAFLVVCAIAFLLAGCGVYSSSGKSELTMGVPPAKAVLEQIKPGITTLTEVLKLLGPPEFIIDGTQELVDYERSSGGVSTRTISAPEGMVILIYTLSLTVDITLDLRTLGGVTMQMDRAIHNNELFIFVSKNDRMVASLVSGRGSE